MSNLQKLPPLVHDKYVRCIVECPRGAQAKFRYDPELKGITLSHSFILGLSYPFDWGFVPSTKCEDGDPLDVMIIHDVPTYPGTILTCVPVGVLELIQREDGKEVRNDRVFTVPRKSHRSDDVEDITRDLPKRMRKELEKFFIATDELENKELEILGWKGPDEAWKLIRRAIAECKGKG